MTSEWARPDCGLCEGRGRGRGRGGRRPLCELCYAAHVGSIRSENERLTRECDARYSATEIVEVFGSDEGVCIVVELEKARILR